MFKFILGGVIGVVSGSIVTFVIVTWMTVNDVKEISRLQTKVINRDYQLLKCSTILNERLPEVERLQARIITRHNKRNEIIEKLGIAWDYNIAARRIERSAMGGE